MDVGPIPTVEEMIPWYRIGRDATAAARDLSKTATDLREAVSGIYTFHSVGVYVDPAGKQAALMGRPSDCVFVAHALRDVLPVVYGEMTDDWVKVAYSPELRTTGEYLGFFHGNNPLTASPSPVRSMITSGLVGAGLGYGAGWLAEKLLPDKWEKGRLSGTLGIAGGLAGVAPGLGWGAMNKAQGKNFNDPSLLNPTDAAGKYVTAFANVAARRTALDDKLYKIGFDAYGTGAGGPDDRLAVNIDYMGRTLWDAGASPQLAGVTMGVLQAASQLPGGNDDPGFVTPTQMANLALQMGAGYASGAVVGNVLGLLAGMSKRTGMYTGIIRAVIPRMFG